MINVGDKVKWRNRELHLDEPEFYPAPGTVGVVESVHRGSCETLIVQWPEYSTSGDDRWMCDPRCVQVMRR